MERQAAILNGLTPQQCAAATQMGAVLVLAGAGTGKTKTLTRAVANRIETHRIPAARILVVTFTNKAACEMSDRIRATLGDQAAPHWTGTFHGLGARQLRTEPEVAGLRPGFDILDADDSQRIVKRVMKGMNLASGDEGMTISHCEFRRGYAVPSSFLDDIPNRNRVTGWLRAPARKPGRATAIFDDRLDAAELLRRF